MKISPQGLGYLIGLVPFGFFYIPIENIFASQWLFVIFAFGYLAMLRLIGWLVASRIEAGKHNNDA